MTIDILVLLVIAMMIFVAVASWWLGREVPAKEPLVTQTQAKKLTPTFALQTPLWWFVDDGTNARKWWDFGARNSHAPNRGYLSVALECVKATQGGDYAVMPLIGRNAVSQVIRDAGGVVPEGIESVPVALWREWALSNLLAYKGGLAIAGDSVLCTGPSFAPLVKDAQAAVFGIYPDEPRVLPGSKGVGPAPWVGWSMNPHHPGWDWAAGIWTQLVAAGPTAWTASEARRQSLDVWVQQEQRGVQSFQAAEGGRKIDGYERTFEDLFTKVTEPSDPKAVVPEGTLYIPMDGDRLVRSHRYSWFVRMSPQQILKSDFVWAGIARSVLRPTNIKNGQ